MKKSISLIMAVLMLIQILALGSTVVAAETPSISLSSGEGNEGATVVLSVSIANNTGFAGISLDVQFDKNVLEFVSAESKIIGNGIFQLTPVDVANENGIIHLENVDITANNSANGEIFNVTFKIKEGAALGDSAVNLVLGEGSFYLGANGVDMLDFTATVTGGKVTVTDGMLGDVNLDGEIDANDLTALARHIAGIEVLTAPLALSNADIDENDDISAEDLTKLARHVAGIEVIQ